MLEVRAKVSIRSSPRVIWEYMNNVEGWWTLSSADHVSLEFSSAEHSLKEGVRATLKEQFGNIKGESQGIITKVIPDKEVMWRSERAVYSYLFFDIPVDQIVTWSVQEQKDGVALSMEVRLVFSNTLWGKICEWYFVYMLRGKRLVADHSFNELMYIKRVIEGG